MCRYVQVEYGPMELDLNLRVRIYELERHLKGQVSLTAGSTLKGKVSSLKGSTLKGKVSHIAGNSSRPGQSLC